MRASAAVLNFGALSRCRSVKWAVSSRKTAVPANQSRKRRNFFMAEG